MSSLRNLIPDIVFYLNNSRFDLLKMRDIEIFNWFKNAPSWEPTFTQEKGLITYLSTCPCKQKIDDFIFAAGVSGSIRMTELVSNTYPTYRESLLNSSHEWASKLLLDAQNHINHMNIEVLFQSLCRQRGRTHLIEIRGSIIEKNLLASVIGDSSRKTERKRI